MAQYFKHMDADDVDMDACQDDLNLAEREAGTAQAARLIHYQQVLFQWRRLYGRTTTSAVPNKYAMTVRHPLGVAGLIIAANTPIANVAWKVFPALICGNTAVLKAAEDTPATAWYFGKLAQEAGLPAGVLNIVNGFGTEAGKPLASIFSMGMRNVMSFGHRSRG